MTLAVILSACGPNQSSTRVGGTAGQAAARSDSGAAGLQRASITEATLVAGASYLSGRESAAPTRAQKTLSFKVLDLSGQPCSDVAVQIRTKGGSVHAGETNRSGVASIQVPEESRVTCVQATPSAGGLAAYKNIVSRSEDGSVNAAAEHVIELMAGGALGILALGSEGEPLAYQVIVGQYREPVRPNDDSGSFEVMTDETGHAFLPALLCGRWSVYGLEGRGHCQTDRSELVVQASGRTDSELSFEPVPRAEYVSGCFDALAKERHDEFFRLRDYYVERKGGNSLDFIGGDGTFFLSDKRATYEIRVVDKPRDRRSRWVEVKVGEHGGRFGVVWD